VSGAELLVEEVIDAEDALLLALQARSSHARWARVGVDQPNLTEAQEAIKATRETHGTSLHEALVEVYGSDAYNAILS
jgi:hypothetical protein